MILSDFDVRIWRWKIFLGCFHAPRWIVLYRFLLGGSCSGVDSCPTVGSEEACMDLQLSLPDCAVFFWLLLGVDSLVVALVWEV